MRQVPVDVVETFLASGRHSLAGIVATCTRCQQTTESYGTSDRSVKRCLVLMREGCFMGEHNYYIEGAHTDLPRQPRGRTHRQANDFINDQPKQNPKRRQQLRLTTAPDGALNTSDDRNSLWLSCRDEDGARYHLLLDVEEVTQLLLALKKSAIRARR